MTAGRLCKVNQHGISAIFRVERLEPFERGYCRRAATLGRRRERTLPVCGCCLINSSTLHTPLIQRTNCAILDVRFFAATAVFIGGRSEVVRCLLSCLLLFGHGVGVGVFSLCFALYLFLFVVVFSWLVFALRLLGAVL